MSTLTSLIEEHGGDVPGYLGSERYEVVDQRDTPVEIAEWESVEGRAAHVQEAVATGASGPSADRCDRVLQV